MDPQKRIIDLTVLQLAEIIKEITEVSIKMALSTQYNNDLKNKVLSINQLAELGIVGKYHRIKTLIESGEIKQTADGKISGLSVWEYLNSSAA